MTERSASSLSKVSTTTSKSTNSKVSTSNNNNATATNSRPNSRINGDGEVLSSEEKQAGQVISTETNQDESSPTIPNERSGDTFSAWKAFLSKLRSSVLIDYAEEKNRVAFRNQFFQHVKEVYKKLNLQEEDIIPRLEKIDSMFPKVKFNSSYLNQNFTYIYLQDEGNWSSNAAHAIKADLFGSIEYNIKKQLEANKALREPKPIEYVIALIFDVLDHQLCGCIISKSELLFNVATTVSRDFTLSSICSKYFHDINLSSCKITEIDSEFVNYCKFLEVLSLSFNKLTSIRCLPQNLYGLTAYSNSISKIVPLKTFANIVHLGLGYNRLNNLAFVENCPYIASLDVSFNDLTSLEQSLQSLTKVPSLKTLNLQGNCFCLLEHYRGAVFSYLPKIETLDNESFSEESRKRYMDLFHGFSSDKKTKLVVTLSSLTGVNFDDEIKLIEDETTSTNDAKSGKKTPIKRIPSASKKKAPNAKKPSEIIFFKSIYYIVRFSWPKEDDKDEISFIESNPVYLPDPDPKTNSRIVSIDFKDSFEFLISEKSLGVKHHIEKPLSFYVYRIVANIQDDDDSNKIELSRDLLGILFANFNEFWEKGFSLPVPIPEDDDSAKSGDELKALMKNSLEERHNLQNDVSTSSCSGLTMGVSITQPSEIWDNYEKDWKDPKKRKQALKTANANNKKPPSRK